MISKESIHELQKIDCNCNDCIFMIRNIDKFKDSIEKHHKWQLDYFNCYKNKLIVKANYHKNRFYNLEFWDLLLTEAEDMKFQFNKNEAIINFGYCEKLSKEVSFIPNTCQIETQECFKHRKDSVLILV